MRNLENEGDKAKKNRPEVLFPVGFWILIVCLLLTNVYRRRSIYS